MMATQSAMASSCPCAKGRASDSRIQGACPTTSRSSGKTSSALAPMPSCRKPNQRTGEALRSAALAPSQLPSPMPPITVARIVEYA